MSQDIVDNLRFQAQVSSVFSPDISKALFDAIDEIERLRTISTPDGYTAFYIPTPVIEDAKGNEASMYYLLANEIVRSTKE